jgi:hypothetical protein
MREVYRKSIDDIYMEPVHISDDESCPIDCVEVHPNHAEKGGHFYKYKWVMDHWEEGLTQAEIDVLKSVPAPVSELENLKKQQADLIFELMMNGVI